MNIIKKIQKKIVYALTEKPNCYVHVDAPKTLQDMRQIQYNNWCKAKGVYNGSYLPKDHTILTHKGWLDVTHPLMQCSDKRQYERKSTGQRIEHHDVRINDNGVLEKAHYHWINTQKPFLKNEKGEKYNRYDRYGKLCIKHSKESHLAALDKDYDFNGKTKNRN